MSLAALTLMPEAGSASRLSILLVDDTADVRFLLRRVLEADGRFEVIGEAANGVEGVQLATVHRPDVAIVDLAMPVMDGFQAIPLIRGESPHTKVVVLTAFRGSRIAAEAAGAGADAYVEKGNGIDGLIGVIASLYARGDQRPAAAAPHQGEIVAPSTVSDVSPSAVIDEVLSKLNHELRTPLAVIQGFAVRIQDMAAEPSPDPDMLRRSAEAIERNASVLSTMLQSFSDARDVDAGRLDLELEDVSLAEFVAQLVADLEVVTGAHPLTVVLADGMVVRGDRMRLRQIVTNLVSNAAKFSPPGSGIEVRLARRGASAELSVRDGGPGIPHEHEAEVFRKFARLTKGVRGTGLGLYISRGIARAHAGELRLVENGDDGCRFALSLPVAGPSSTG